MQVDKTPCTTGKEARRTTDKVFTLLCIDDETVNLKVLASIFKESYKLVVCKNAKQGFEKALEVVPDLILLDVIMPQESGFDLIVKLKEHHELSHIPVIFITGLQSAEDEEKGLTLGACDYIQKPFNYSIVRARVNTHLEIIRQRKLLEKFANFDSLTELPNRRKWNDDSDDIWQSYAEKSLPIVFGIADIDHFKKYNDLYGHQQGDMVLRKLSQAIERVFNYYGGRVYRCGGEEFYFYLPVQQNVNADQILNECLISIKNLNILHEGSSSQNVVSMSLGAVKLTPNQFIALDKVMKVADDQLYKIKNTTRNAIRLVDYDDYQRGTNVVDIS